jgi:hypothetical protein
MSPVNNTSAGRSAATCAMAASQSETGVAQLSSGIPNGSAASDALSVCTHVAGMRGHVSCDSQ